jgi:hypothetical protein
MLANKPTGSLLEPLRPLATNLCPSNSLCYPTRLPGPSPLVSDTSTLHEPTNLLLSATTTYLPASNPTSPPAFCCLHPPANQKTSPPPAPCLLHPPESKPTALPQISTTSTCLPASPGAHPPLPATTSRLLAIRQARQVCQLHPPASQLTSLPGAPCHPHLPPSDPTRPAAPSHLHLAPSDPTSSPGSPCLLAT